MKFPREPNPSRRRLRCMVVLCGSFYVWNRSRNLTLFISTHNIGIDFFVKLLEIEEHEKWLNQSPNIVNQQIGAFAKFNNNF
jgi:hypothetical protein